MPKREYPRARFTETPEERAEREYQEKRERSKAKVEKHFPKTTEAVRKIERRLGMKVRIIGLIEDGKIMGRTEADTIAQMTERNGGPLKRISPDPDKED